MFEQKFSKFRNTLEASGSKENSISHIPIGQKYHIKSVISQTDDYNLFKGVDVQKCKWVSLYAKRVQHSYELSSKIKDHLRSQLCPKILWTGPVTIAKINYYFQVHERFGPSIRAVFEYKNSAPTQKELLHLLYQMVFLFSITDKTCIKNEQCKFSLWVIKSRYDNIRSNATKKRALSAELFQIKKEKRSYETYLHQILFERCSSWQKFVFLKVGVTTKDDLQSICYILIDIFCQGRFLHNKKPVQFQEAKLSMKIEQFAQGLPSILVDFYHFVTSLNYNDEINFFYWKNTLLRMLTNEIATKPFGFLMKKEGSKRDLSSKWSPRFEEIQKKIEQDQINQYEESQNVIRLKKIAKHILQK